jgi:hypothetical protein
MLKHGTGSKLYSKKFSVLEKEPGHYGATVEDDIIFLLSWIGLN